MTTERIPRRLPTGGRFGRLTMMACGSSVCLFKKIRKSICVCLFKKTCESTHCVPCRVVSCRVMSRRVVSCRVVSYCVVSCRAVSYRVVLCRVVSYCVVSCRVVSCRVVMCLVLWPLPGLCCCCLRLILQYQSKSSRATRFVSVSYHFPFVFSLFAKGWG